MDVWTRLKLMAGPARPFILGKIADAMRITLRSAALKRKLFEVNGKQLSFSSNHFPLPRGMGNWELGIRNSEFRTRNVEPGTWNLERGEKDFRLVLEYSRMHQWCAYAAAAQLDAHKKEQLWFAFRDEVIAFHNEHPAPDGPMWQVAMDVGIRTFNMLVALDWFTQLGMSDVALTDLVCKQSACAAHVIHARIERSGGMATSHYLGDILGLLAVGVYIGGDADAVSYAEFAASELLNEIRSQILNDGMNFEASTAYHRHVVDILLCSSILLFELPFERDDDDVDLFDRLSNALHAQRILDSFGMPLIGDNDDGMALKLTGPLPDTSWMYSQASRIVPLQHAIAKDVGNRHAFEEFGLWLYRHGDACVSLRCGSNGQYGKGGHAHNDKNSITLSLRGEPFIVDPGSCWYSGDSKRRNADRSVHSHATVVVDNNEQSKFLTGGGENLWWMFDEPGFEAKADENFWIGSVHTPKGRHLRHVHFNVDSQIDVTDTIPENARGSAVFPLGSSISVAMNGSTATLRGNFGAIELSWDSAAARIADIQIAPHFGQSVSSHALILDMLEHKLTWTVKVLPI